MESHFARESLPHDDAVCIHIPCTKRTTTIAAARIEVCQLLAHVLGSTGSKERA